MKTLKLCYKYQTLEIPFEGDISQVDLKEIQTFFSMMKMLEENGALEQPKTNTSLNSNKWGYKQQQTSYKGNYPQNNYNAYKAPNNQFERITPKQVSLLQAKGVFTNDMFNISKQEAANIIDRVLGKPQFVNNQDPDPASIPTPSANDISNWEL